MSKRRIFLFVHMHICEWVHASACVFKYALAWANSFKGWKDTHKWKCTMFPIMFNYWIIHFYIWLLFVKKSVLCEPKKIHVDKYISIWILPNELCGRSQQNKRQQRMTTEKGEEKGIDGWLGPIGNSRHPPPNYKRTSWPPSGLMTAIDFRCLPLCPR